MGEMAAIAWAAPVSNNFNNAGSWTGGVAPGSGDDALLTVAGSTYTVTVNAGATVNSLQTASNATLLIGTGLGFSLTNGTGTGANAGQISVSNNSDLYIGGTFNNTNKTGGIVLNGTANNTELRLTGATTTFTGGGAVVMGTGGDNEIQGDSGAANTLTNVNNTISGVGNLGNGAMTFVNQTAGVVNANQTGQLTLNVNGGVTNTGTLEATNTGGLFIVNTGITNTGGVIEATGSGAHVDLQSSTISGGSLESGAGAQIDVVGGQTAYLNGSATAVTITSGSNVNVNNNAYLYASGSIINDGTINLEGTANSTELRLRTPSTTLSGGGQVVMGTGGDNEIQGDGGAANTLTNVNNTISGVGNLGNAALTFVNQAAGVVNANQTSALTINVNGGVTNTGLLEASNSGGLFIVNTAIDNTGGGNSGKISATASGAHVDLQSDTIYGGVLSSAAGAYIDVVGGQSATLDGSQPGGAVTIASGTNVNVNNNAYLYLAGSIVNDGTITLAGTANSTDLRLTTPITTLTGGGQVVLGGSGVGFDYIVANNSDAQELDNVNNTISGQGNIGNGSLTLVNEAAGVITANQTNGLTLNVNGGVSNKGLLEATNTGGLFILNTGVNDSGNGNTGLIEANGAGAHVDLQSATIYGGTLESGTGAFLDIVGGQSATLDGSLSAAPVTIAAGSNLNVNNNSSLYLRGTLNNAGTINLNGGANATAIRLNTANVYLQGGGFVDLSNSTQNEIVGADNSTETLNNVNDTIQGSGNIGAGNMTLVNGAAGVIDADQGASTSNNLPGQLIIQDNGGVTNAGLLESSVGAGQTVGGDLFILNTGVNNGATGIIDANGTNAIAAKVDLQNSTIAGGTLQTVGTNSIIEVVSGQSATFDGTVNAVTEAGAFAVNNNATLNVRGNIVVGKYINLLAGANATGINVDSATVTLSGFGQINMGPNGNGFIKSDNANQDLFNVSTTIQGAGNIGEGTNLQITNETLGIINGRSAAAMVINESRTLNNYGLIESNPNTNVAGGLLILNTAIDNTVANAAGVLNTGKMMAIGTGLSNGHIDLQGGNIYGGTLTSTGGGYFDVVAGQSGGLYGTQLGQAANITAGSQFLVNNNSTLYLGGVINNAGTITLEGSANNTVLSMNSPVVSLGGGGNVVLDGGYNIIGANSAGAELDNLNNNITGAGLIGNGGDMFLSNEIGGEIDATTTGGIQINLAGNQLINAGGLAATGSALSVTNSVFNTGELIADGSNLTIGGNVNGTGTEIVDAASTLEIGQSTGGLSNQTVEFARTVAAASAGTFKIDTAQNFTGSVVDFATGDTLDLASINFGSAVLSYAGNSSGGVLTVTDGTETANIKLVGNYTQASFGTAADSGTGTLVTYTGAAAAAIVADTAANLSGTELDALQASGAATSSIVVVDSGKVQTNVAQLTTDAGALAKMTAADEAPYTLKVVDTAANESGAGLDKAQANGHVKSIIVSDNGSSEGGYVQASVAQLTSDASVLSGLAFANGQLTGILNVTDTAAHINPALDALNADTQIGKIVVSDNNVVSATVLQITNDTTALGEMVNANGTSLKIRVDDVAVNMSSGTQLDRVNANSHVTSVIVSDNGLSLGGYVRVTVAQLSSDTKALGELAFANGQTLHTLNVTDSAANISADLTALNSDTQIGRITVNDGHQITLTAAAFNADTTAESEMRGANASTLPLYAITDTAANLNGKSFTGLATGGDAIDATDIAFAHETATFTENSAGTAGTLTLSDGTHSASVTLFGQYAAAGFSGTAVAAGFSVAMDAGTGTKLTLLASVSH
jgi:filamentous hemagglutinin